MRLQPGDGKLKCVLLDGLTVGSNVVVVVQPESINVNLEKPTDDGQYYRR